MGRIDAVLSAASSPDPEPRPLFGKEWQEWHGRMLKSADELGFKRDAELVAQGIDLNDPYYDEDRPRYRNGRRERTHEQIEGDQRRFV